MISEQNILFMKYSFTLYCYPSEDVFFSYFQLILKLLFRLKHITKKYLKDSNEQHKQLHSTFIFFEI